MNLSYFGGIISDTLEASRGFESVNFSWVRRSGNFVAHYLSHYALSCNSLYLSSSILEAIVNALDVDSLALD